MLEGGTQIKDVGICGLKIGLKQWNRMMWADSEGSCCRENSGLEVR